MSSLRIRTARVLAAAAAVLGLFAAPTVLIDPPAAQHQAQPCYNGITPGNPWETSCNFGPRPPKVRGGMPDQNAVIACRGFPGCLSAYINGP
ncbi:hypothetical protein [Mycolicibacterium pulveris]|uniref:hypothetical protein n=1 Tax=Mycolicibacterium pulveris TaxID=36813 RepID=UPI003CEAB4AA